MINATDRLDRRSDRLISTAKKIVSAISAADKIIVNVSTSLDCCIIMGSIIYRERIFLMTKLGTFYGIGVGPGDPELLTVKAINAIKSVDVIIAPKTEKKEGSVALSIARSHIKPTTEIICQVFPMVKDFSEWTEVFDGNKAEIMSNLRRGKDVAFLTIGDPMFYSTYIYIFRLLRAEGVDVVTIPGVPAFLAIASQLGRPLAFGNEIISIIPATAPRGAIEKALGASDAAVLMKVYKNLDEIVDALERSGKLDEATLVSRSGLPDEKIISDLKNHRGERLNYLSTIITK